jgi:zinc transport system ATP-binding protein
MKSMDEPAINIKDLSFYYRKRKVLKDINLQVPHKSFLAIIGPNGGGKSTLLRLMLGLITPSQGEVQVFGRDPRRSREFTGYLPQHVSFLHDFPINVEDTVLTGRYHGLFHGYDQEDREAVHRALEMVEMEGLEDRQMGQLSGGQVQRVFLARALVRDPKLLLLDEPMSSVDPQMQFSFYQLLEKLKKKMTIILVTHDVGAVFDQVELMACLNQRLFYHGQVEGAGKVIEKMYGCPLELVTHGSTPHRVLKEH